MKYCFWVRLYRAMWDEADWVLDTYRPLRSVNGPYAPSVRYHTIVDRLTLDGLRIGGGP